MPKSGRKTKNTISRRIHAAEIEKENLLKQLAKFEWFTENILPAMQSDLKAGKGEAELREKYAALIQAQMITTAMVDQDAKVRIAASRDILDRKEGKAKERVEQTHKFDKMKEEEVDALLLSKLKEVEDGEEESLTH